MANMRASIELAAKKQGFVVFDELRGHLTKVSAESARTQREMQAINAYAHQMQNGLRAAAAGFKSLLAVTGVTLGIGAAVHGFMGLTHELLATTKELQAVSQSFGVSTQAMQAWSMAAKPLGIETDKMADIFKDVSDKIGDFATTGGGEAKDLFEKLGLSVKDFVGLAPDQALLRIGAALDKSGLTRSQKIFLMEGLADEASRLLPLLEDNAKKLEEVRQKALIRGQIMSPADIAMLDVANAKISESSGAMAGLKHQIALLGAEFMTLGGTGFTEFIDSISAKLMQFDLTMFVAQAQHGFLVFEELGKQSAMYVWTEFQVLMANLSTEWPATFAVLGAGWDGYAQIASAEFAAISSISTATWAAIQSVWSGELSISQAFAGLQPTVSAAMAGLVDTVKTAFANLQAASSASPLGQVLVDASHAMVAGVRGAFADLQGVWTQAQATWASITVGMAASTDSLVSGQQSGWGSLPSIVSGALSLIGGYVQGLWDTAIGLMTAGLQVLQGDFSGAFATIEGVASGFVERLKSTFATLGGNLLPEDLRTMGSDMLSGLGTVIADVVPMVGQMVADVGGLIGELRQTIWYHWDDITAVTSAAWTGISTVISVAWDAAVGAITVALRLLRGDFYGAWDEIMAGVDKVSGWVSSAFSGLFSPLTDSVDSARAAIGGFFDWWAGTTLQEKAADITFGLITAAWNAAQGLQAWWDSWSISEKTAAVEASLIQTAWDLAQRFHDWWQGLSLKSLIPEINIPSVGDVWGKMKQIGADVAGGIADGINSATAHIAAAEGAGQAVEGGLRNTLDTHSPSRVAADIGKDVASGLAQGISSGGMEAGAAAAGVADAVTGQLRSSYQSFVDASNDRIAASRAGVESLRAERKAAQEAAASAADMASSVNVSAAAMGASGTAAKVAADGKRKLSEAQKEAKKAAEELAKAHEKIAELFEKEAQNHEVLTVRLNQGADAARAVELQNQTMHNGVKILSAALAAELVQKENINKALEEEIKRREDAAQAVKKAQEAVDQSAISMRIARDSIYSNDEALRALTLSHEEGYSKAAAESQAHNEALTQSYENQRAIVKDLEKLNYALASSDAELAALKAGGAAAYEAERTRQAAINELKEKNIVIESALGQSYITSKLAIEQKAKALAAEQTIQENLKNIDWLTKEIAATQQGVVALAGLNTQKELSNELAKAGLTLESEFGQRLADTVKQLAAKNHELERTQFLTESANQSQWLEKEIAATLAGEKALKALNLQKEINEQLTRLKIATGTQEAAQVATAITQQTELKDRLASIQELRQPINQFFNDVFSGGKKAFQGLQDFALTALKRILVEYATNKVMLSISVDATGKGGLLGGVGDKITGFLGNMGKSISGAITGLFGSGGLGGLLGSIAGALGPVGLIAGAVSLLKGLTKKDGNLVFGQGMQAGQQLTGQGGHNGQEHYRQTALGLIGATSNSNKIGREKDFVPKFHEALDAMKALDDMIAKALPDSVDKFKAALSGLETKGFSLDQIMQQRYSTILKALPEELQKAMTAGKDIMSMSSEELIAAFNRISAAQTTLIPTLDQLGWASGKTKDAVLAMALGLSSAAGGMDQLKTQLDAYYQAAYTDAERAKLTQDTARAAVEDYNKQLGLSKDKYIENMAGLRAYIEAQDKSTEAGQKAIAAALGMVDALTKLNGTAEEAAQKLKDQWSAFNDAAYTDSQKSQMARNQAKKSIDAFNQSLGLTGDKTIDNINELRAYMRTLNGNTEAGRKAQQAALAMTGAFVAFGGTAEQIKQKVSGLKDLIKGLVGNLYGTKTDTTNNQSTTAAQAALDAAESSLSSLQKRYDDEKQRIEALNSAAQEAYREELARYEQLKGVAVDLRDFIAGFKRTNELLTPAQKLNEIQSQYNATLAKASTGDVDAVKNLQSLADELKQSYLDVYASSKPSQDAIAKILNDLSGLAIKLDASAGTAPNQPGTIGSTTLASLEQQIAAQQATISSLQSAANAANSAANATNTAADRAAMAKELATKIGELGLATDKSAWDILAKNGINISNLAADFGINVKQLDATFIRKTADLADRLNVNSLDLLTRLNVNFSDLAAKFGIDISKLNTGTLGKLDTLADQLKVSSVDLAAKLGINIDKLGDLMANKLAALPNIPADIKAGLAPHLQDIRNAADPATLQRELRELQAYVNSLPPGIKGQLNAQLAGILGYTGDTKTNTADTKTEALALRSIRSAVDNTSNHTADLTAYTRDQVNARGIQLALQNSRALNQYAASIGKSAIPSFDVGTDYLSRDGVIMAHQGEAIFSPSQSLSLRERTLVGLGALPMIEAMLVRAANEPKVVQVTPAPQVIDARPVFTGNQREQDNRTQQELLAEIRELNRKVERLEQGQQYYGNLHAQQGDTAIRQRDESNQTQKQARRDTYRAGRNVA